MPPLSLDNDVTLEEHGGHGHGQDVGDDVLDGVGVGGGQRHRGSPLVVLFVDPLQGEGGSYLYDDLL